MTDKIKARALEYHSDRRGKIETGLKKSLDTREDLSLAYTPGVAYVCQEIARDEALSYSYTSKGNTVAVITDGSAVLGLGDIGPSASMPVMEGKCALFKKFGGVDAFPLAIASQEVDEFVRTVELIGTGFAGINLEDISAPRCFEIEKKLSERMNIPVFHDDQHGTAIVVLAALINALKITAKKDPKILISGAGAAGLATAELLLEAGFKDLVVLDSLGVVEEGREDLNPFKRDLAKRTNPDGIRGNLEQAIRGRDVFIGLSAPGILSPAMVTSMAKDPIIFACSNPEPEIDRSLAKRAGARIVATGLSDDSNQINNVLVFPGLFRGLFDAGIKKLDRAIYLRLARALASYIDESELGEDFFVASVFDSGLVDHLARSLKDL